MSFLLNFRNFLIDNKVFITVIGLLLGEEIRRLSRSFVSNLIEPIFDLDLNGDRESDMNSLFTKNFKVKGMHFHLGPVLRDSIHFIVMVIIAFFISIITRKLITPDQ